MLKIEKVQKGNVLEVTLIGPIEESANFEAMIGATPSEIRVNCKNVPRINSVGVKAWIKYFSSLQAKNVKIVFTECSTSLVEQMNLISNFTCGGTVDSLFVPFACEACGGELLGLFKVDILKKANFNLPEMQCSKCNGTAEFDDVPEEYFYFLMK